MRCTAAAPDTWTARSRLTASRCTALRTNRDVLFDGSGPDVSEENLQPLREAVLAKKAAVGLATDGDADRFGILDSDGTWMQPNHILGAACTTTLWKRADGKCPRRAAWPLRT